MSGMLYLLAILSTACSVNTHRVTEAIAHLQSDVVTGSVTFTEQADGRVRVTGVVEGLAPGPYGFHVHQLGDPTDGCLASGAHYNPEEVAHGGPDHDVRHVGDFGNVDFDATGTARIDFVDRLVGLNGENSVVGRTLVLHAAEDDLGLGGHADSLSTGNAGARIGCGVIGILQEVSEASAPPLSRPLGWLVLTFMSVLMRRFY